MQKTQTNRATPELDEADVPLRATRYPLCSPEDMEEAFEAAALSGLYTPEQLEWMRQHKIRPASKEWEGPSGTIRVRSWWLAFLFRTANRLMGKR